MIELQVLNKVLNDQSLAFLLQNGITPEHFVTYRDEFQYIWDHYHKYGNVPDKHTFLARFEDFDLFEVNESPQYLVETLQEQYLYSLMVPFVHTIAEKVKVNSNEAIEYATAQLEKIRAARVGYRGGVDIARTAGERVKEYRNRVAVKGLLGISTGLPELDQITHGWLSEDLVVIVGRTNEGKSWVLDFFLVQAHNQRKRVLLYSGEMSEIAVGFRVDTLMGHFSNEALMHGLESLGTKDEPKTVEDYEQFALNLSKSDVPFVVITPKHLGGRRLDIPTLRRLIEEYKPDIVGIDQLSLMEDYRANSGTPIRLQYTHIAEDLFAVSEYYGIPILTAAQANRDSLKDEDKAPELHHVQESDGVAQNATRVISIKRLDVTYKFRLTKNRYGRNNEELMVMWDIDRGIVRPFLHTNSEGQSRLTPKAKKEGEELF